MFSNISQPSAGNDLTVLYPFNIALYHSLHSPTLPRHFVSLLACITFPLHCIALHSLLYSPNLYPLSFLSSYVALYSQLITPNLNFPLFPLRNIVFFFCSPVTARWDFKIPSGKDESRFTITPSCGTLKAGK